MHRTHQTMLLFSAIFKNHLAGFRLRHGLIGFGGLVQGIMVSDERPDRAAFAIEVEHRGILIEVVEPRSDGRDVSRMERRPASMAASISGVSSTVPNSISSKHCQTFSRSTRPSRGSSSRISVMLMGGTCSRCSRGPVSAAKFFTRPNRLRAVLSRHPQAGVVPAKRTARVTFVPRALRAGRGASGGFHRSPRSRRRRRHRPSERAGRAARQCHPRSARKMPACRRPRCRPPLFPG